MVDKFEVIAEAVFNETYGVNSRHKLMARDMFYLYLAETKEHPDRDPVRKVSNYIWMWYAGGTTAYSAGERIIKEYKGE